MNLSPLPQYVSPASRDGGDHFRCDEIDTHIPRGVTGNMPPIGEDAVRFCREDMQGTTYQLAPETGREILCHTDQFAGGGVESRHSAYAYGALARVNRASQLRRSSARPACNSFSMSVPAPDERCQRDDAGHGKPNASARGCRHRRVAENLAADMLHFAASEKPVRFRPRPKPTEGAAGMLRKTWLGGWWLWNTPTLTFGQRSDSMSKKSQGKPAKRREPSWWDMKIATLMGDVAAVRPLTNRRNNEHDTREMGQVYGRSQRAYYNIHNH